MKRLTLLFSTLLILGSCGNDNKTEKPPSDIASSDNQSTVKVEGTNEQENGKQTLENSESGEINGLDSVVFWESEGSSNEDSKDEESGTEAKDTKIPSAAISLISSSAESKSIVLKWTKDNDATEYTILWSSTLNQNLSKQTKASDSGDETYTIEDIDTSGDDYISIFACNNLGCNSKGITLGPI